MISKISYILLSFILLIAQANAILIDSTHKTNAQWNSIHKIIETLKNSDKGLALLKEAKRKAYNNNLSLTDIIKAGELSLTDTTLIRKFSSTNPNKIIYEEKAVIYINKNSNILDAVLDLAHELTHYIYKESFNPYNQSFSQEKFIASTIEDIGGEAHAFVNECIVLYELTNIKNSRASACLKIYDVNLKSFSKDMAIKEFYKVGNFYKYVSKFSPKITNETPSLISMVYDLPYPVAAIKEYRSIIKTVCENNQKRLKIRSIASAYDRRCANLE